MRLVTAKSAAFTCRCRHGWVGITWLDRTFDAFVNGIRARKYEAANAMVESGEYLFNFFPDDDYVGGARVHITPCHDPFGLEKVFASAAHRP